MQIAIHIIFYFKIFISNNKIANQSHTYNNIYYKYGASKSVDLNSETCTRTYPLGVNDPVKTVCWKVDLGMGVQHIQYTHPV